MGKRASWLASVLFVATATTGFAHASEILIGTGEFPPYATEKTDDQGCALNIIRHAYEAERWAVHFRFLPWPRNLVSLSRGEIDASAYWAKRPDRQEELIFAKNPVAAEIYKFVFPKDAIVEWDTYEDLRGKTIIINSSYTYNEEFYEALDEFEIEIIAVAAEDQNLGMLLKGRADLTIMNEKVFRKYVSELSADEQLRLHIGSKPALTVHGFLVFSKADSETSRRLADVFDSGYAKIRRDEELREAFKTCGF